MNYPIEDYIINFLARKESPEDVQKLKDWLAVDPARRNELKKWLAAWDSAGMMDATEKFDPEKAYQRFMFRVSAEETSKITHRKFRMNATVFKTVSRIAAVIAISFSLGMLCHYYLSKNQPEQIAFIEDIVPLGSKSEIKMPDGSTVMLNAGSTLRCPTNYGKTKRDVYLSGEGYFSISQQAGKPFTVYTSLANITVLGTEFNVKTYPEENVLELTVIKGELAVEKGEAANAFDRTIVKQGQKLSVTLSDLQPVVTPLDPEMAEAEVSWKDRVWRFEGETLQNLAVKLERRYDVKITVDDSVKDYRYTGSIEGMTLEQVLNYIKISRPILFQIDGKNVEIYMDSGMD